MITLLLFAMLQQQPIRQTVVSPTIPAHQVIVDHGQIQIHLLGLVRDADWVLGVVTKGNSRVTVSQVHVNKSLSPEKFDTAPPLGYMTPMKSIEAWDAQHIHTRPGVVDIDGLASIAEDGVFMIYLDVPPDTKVIVNRDDRTTPQIRQATGMRDSRRVSSSRWRASRMVMCIFYHHGSFPVCQARAFLRGRAYSYHERHPRLYRHGRCEGVHQGHRRRR